jgi:hypothetical protein
MLPGGRSVAGRSKGGDHDRRYRVFGAEMSPYPVKAASYFRCKAISHQWILHNATPDLILAGAGCLARLRA